MTNLVSMLKVIASVKALIAQKGKILLVYEKLRKNGTWDLPGGKIEYGETPHEALNREIREELNISIEIKNPLGVYWFYTEHNKHEVICSTFLCTGVEGSVIDISKNPADENITEYKWVTKKDILEKRVEPITESLVKLLLTSAATFYK